MNRIGEYDPITPLKTVGSGSARWCIACREGHRFFVKEFLSPVYPGPEKTGAMAQKQRERCQRFEEQKRRLYAALSCVIGDTLVPVLDFFRHEGRYYAVSEEVQGPYQDWDMGQALPYAQRKALIRTLVQCLSRLHVQGIVHADLKPEHLLLVERAGQHQLRLIDMDSGFLEEEPPREERDIEGDPVYLAPETFLRLTGADAPLTAKLDIFALGILIHKLWTGELPGIDGSQYAYVYEAVLSGGEVRLSPRLPEEYREAVARMLDGDPAQRPEAREIAVLFEGHAPPMAAGPGKPVSGMGRLLKKDRPLL